MKMLTYIFTFANNRECREEKQFSDAEVEVTVPGQLIEPLVRIIYVHQTVKTTDYNCILKCILLWIDIIRAIILLNC